jgi:glutamine synthetase
MIVLNTIVANQLTEFKKEMDERLAAGEEKESSDGRNPEKVFY